jgi:hypothetical protein
MMFVDKPLAQERYQICRTCDSFAPLVKICHECGCFMPAKVRIASSACPKNHWASAIATEETVYEVNHG